jgi:hypothetical protein
VATTYHPACLRLDILANRNVSWVVMTPPGLSDRVIMTKTMMLGCQSRIGRGR